MNWALVPVDSLALPVRPLGNHNYTRNTSLWYTWVDDLDPIPLTASGGTIYNDHGDTEISLYKIDEADPSTFGAPVSAVAIPSNNTPTNITLTPTQVGLHAITINDKSAGSRLRWTEGMPMVMEASLLHPHTLQARFTQYFFVPVGTTTVGGFGLGHGTIRDADDTVHYDFEFAGAGYFDVPVPPGQDGRVWSFHFAAGVKSLMTVPPYLAQSPEELLLPSELVP